MRRRFGLGSLLVLLAAGAFFLLPLVLTGIFSLWQGGSTYNLATYGKVVNTGAVWTSLLLSLRLTIETAALSLVLLVPAVIVINLRAPRLRAVLEVIAVLPFVVPAIALVAGLTTLYTGPSWLIGTANYLVVPYFIITLPYTYRALDIGIASLDLRTLTEASQSLGASWFQTVVHVVLPNLKAALMGGALLTLTSVMGEYTFAAILLFRTFAVFIADTGQGAITEAAALSLFSFLITWAAMLGVVFSNRRGQTALGGAR